MNFTNRLNASLPDSKVTSSIPVKLSGDLGGVVLKPGHYETEEPLIIQMGDLTLDAQGDENAVWSIHVGSFFTTVGGKGGNIVLSGGAKSKNIYWQIDRLAIIGDGTTFKGNLLTKLNKQLPVKLSPVASNGVALRTPVESSSDRYTRYTEKVSYVFTHNIK